MVFCFWSIHIAMAFIIASRIPPTPIYKHANESQSAVYVAMRDQNVRHNLQIQGLY